MLGCCPEQKNTKDYLSRPEDQEKKNLTFFDLVDLDPILVFVAGMAHG